ncbi:hypothetical protein GQ457_13G010600 [Hibiscus cannabinus]
MLQSMCSNSKMASFSISIIVCVKHQEKVFVITEDYATLNKVNEKWSNHVILVSPHLNSQPSHKNDSLIQFRLWVLFIQTWRLHWYVSTCSSNSKPRGRPKIVATIAWLEVGAYCILDLGILQFSCQEALTVVAYLEARLQCYV